MVRANKGRTGGKTWLISNGSDKVGVLSHQVLVKEIPLETSKVLTALFTERLD